MVKKKSWKVSAEKRGHPVYSLASGYTSQHILCRSPSPEIERVAALRPSGVKILLSAWLGLLSLSSLWLLQAY